MAGEQLFSPRGAPLSGRITPAVFPFYTSGEDNLRIVSFNSVSGVKVRLVARLLGPDGRPTPSGWDHTPNTDRSSASNDFPLSGQTLLNLHVSASSGAPLIGQCYVIVQLIRGIGSAAIVVGTLLAGAVSATQSLGFPGSPIASALEGEPVVRTITGTTPAAGADISETVPTGARWELLTAQWKLTTSALGGNRRPSFVMLTSGGTRLFRPVNATNQGPGVLNIEYFAAPTVGYAADANLINVTMPMPLRPILLAGQRWAVQTIGMQVDDQLSAPTYSVREWLDV